MIEPVTGAITLRNLANVKSLEIVPLDGAGCAEGDARQARKTAAGWEIEIGASAPPWYRITGTQTTRSAGSSRSK